MGSKVNSALCLFGYLLLALALSALNLWIYITSFVAQATPLLTEPQRDAGNGSILYFTLPAYALFSVATCGAIYLLRQKDLQGRRLRWWLFAVFGMSAGNLAIYIQSVAQQAAPYLTEAEMAQVEIALLRQTVPAYVAVSVAVCLAALFLKPKQHGLQARV